MRTALAGGTLPERSKHPSGSPVLLQNSSRKPAVTYASVDLGSARFVRFLPNVSLPHV